MNKLIAVIVVMVWIFIISYSLGYKHGAKAEHEASKYSIGGFMPSDSFKKCIAILDGK